MPAAQGEPKKVRIIQFQMATDPVTAGQFQITSEVAADATAAEIAVELSTLREAGYHEMASANKRKLAREHMVKQVMAEKVSKAKSANKTLNYKRIEEARRENETAIFELESECEADDRALLDNAPVLAAGN
jgi:formylglycine-generating enzyme required for sulfatase activity